MSWVKQVKGQAEVIGAILAVAALFIVLFYMFVSIYAAHQATSFSISLRRDFEVQRLLEVLVAYHNGTQTCIANNGTVPATIVRLWLLLDNGTVVFKKPGDLGLPEPLSLEPGKRICAVLPAQLSAIVTARGKTYTIQQLGLAPIQEAQLASTAQSLVARTVLANVETVSDLINSTQLYVDPSLIEDPTPQAISENRIAPVMVRYDVSGDEYGLVLDKTFSNISLTLSMPDGSPVRVAGILIAHTPGTKDKYNIMIIGPAYDCVTGQPRLVILQQDGSQDRVDLKCYDGTPFSGWRVKIIGFRPAPEGFNFTYLYEISESEVSILPGAWSAENKTIINITTSNIDDVTGYWWLYGGLTKETNIVKSIDDGNIVVITGYGIVAKLFLSGTADEVKYYITVSNTPSNYEPYIFVGDYDGNGFAEIVFTDEDTGFGGAPIDLGSILTVCDDNDDGFFMDYSVNESSLLLIYLNSSQFLVDPSKYGMVEVSARAYFHDNEGAEDGGCVTISDKPILGFYLVDPGPDGRLGTEDDKIVSSHELIYQQLDAEETTYPPNKNFVSITATLAVPESKSPRKYVIAIGFLDPYNGVGANDVDYTLAVEAINVVFYSRS